MPKIEKFESLHIDMEKGIFEVNDRDVSVSGKYMKLEFNNGQWSLMITEDRIFTANDHKGIKE